MYVNGKERCFISRGEQVELTSALNLVAIENQMQVNEALLQQLLEEQQRLLEEQRRLVSTRSFGAGNF